MTRFSNWWFQIGKVNFVSTEIGHTSDHASDHKLLDQILLCLAEDDAKAQLSTNLGKIQDQELAAKSKDSDKGIQI